MMLVMTSNTQDITRMSLTIYTHTLLTTTCIIEQHVYIVYMYNVV